MHADLEKVLKQRAEYLKAIREFFDQKDFLEINCPQMIRANAVEEFIDPLPVTYQDQTFYLHTSPELYLKKILAAGLQQIYSLQPVFRNDAQGQQHIPQFLMLEWYKVGQTLHELMDDCYRLMQTACKVLNPSLRVWSHVSKTWVDFSSGYEIFTMQELWQKYVGIDLHQVLNESASKTDSFFVEKIAELGTPLRSGAEFTDAFFHIMMEKIEPNIGLERPCVIYKWPKQLASLSKICDDGLFCERFEIYAGGMELANAYNELNDAKQQQNRFEQANEVRKANGWSVLPIDYSFIEAVGKLPSCVGVALGVDRLLMLLTEAKNIAEIYPNFS